MPIPLIILCAVLLLLVLLLFLRVRLTIRAKETVTLELRILFLRIRLYPRRKKIKPKQYSARRIARNEKKAAKRAAKSQKKRTKRQDRHAAPADKASLADKIRLVRALIAVLVRRTHRHLTLRAARLHVRVATGDPATTAIAYGAVSQSASYLLAALDQITHLKAAEPHVSVRADFLGERSEIDADITFSIRVWGAILTAVPLLFTFMNTKRTLKSARRKKQQQKISSKKGN